MVPKGIMMVKYNLNVETLYAEQNTLLEPNNFIPSWEAGDEEKKEVSNALRKLRINFDQIHQKVAQKEIELELLRVSLNFHSRRQMLNSKRHVTNLFCFTERR